MGGVVIEFRILGPLTAATADGRTVELGAPKQRALLAELLLARGALVPRDQLVDAIWGEAAPESAAASLQVYVHRLRRALGADRIETRGNGYRVRLEEGELDAERFERLVDRGRRALARGDAAAAAGDLGEALALFAGPALGDLAGQPVAQRGAELEERRLAAVELRNEAELALGRHERLLGDLEALVRDHPYRERLRAQQILALYRAGRQKDALAAYRDVRRAFAEELGVEPGASLRELERAVLRQDPALDAPAAAPAAPAHARLPTPPTPLVGRRLEVASVAALLRRDEVRLVTLTGPGGSGKTRLAIAVAEELIRELPHGAVFVDAAAATDADELARAIAQTLGVGEDADDPVEAALAHLAGDDPPLLVLDNLEQLLSDVDPVRALLAAAPALRVLATSRAPLRLSGEHRYPVPPLPVPAASARFEETADNDAVRLFLARARAVDPDFALTDENVAAVAGICRRLDGLPLALELAAAWTRLLPPGELERRLAGALDLLVRGASDVPARQRTLRATLDWSYGLLDGGERTALARLAVFSAGAPLEAAQVVIDAPDALPRIAALAEHGLVRRIDDDGAPRLLLLETIREYALERLRAEGDEDAARRRHAEWYRGFAEQVQAELTADAGEPALAAFDREHENVRSALLWAADAGEVEMEVGLAVALRLYWNVRGVLREARRLFERVILDSVGRPALHAQALFHGATFAFRRGDVEGARREWETALALFRRLGDEEEAARCTAELGGVAIAEHDLDRAEALYREAATAFAAQGRSMREAAALGNLAAIAAERGDWAKAEAEGERVVDLQRQIDQEGLSISMHNLSRVKLRLDRGAQARALALESLEIAVRLGYREVIAYALGTLSELSLREGELEGAAQLLGRSDAIFAEVGAVRYGEEAASYDRTAVALRERLGEERLHELAGAGAALELERSLAAAH